MKIVSMLLIFLSFNVYSKCTTQSNALEYLTCAIYFESGNQGVDGMELVGHVVLNRLHDHNFPDTIKGVLKQKNQFAYWSRKHLKVLYEKEYNLSKLLALKLIILDHFNLRNDKSKGAIFFRVSNKCAFGKKILKHKSHIFCG